MLSAWAEAEARANRLVERATGSDLAGHLSARLKARPGVRLLSLGASAAALCVELAGQAPRAEIVCIEGTRAPAGRRAGAAAQNVRFVAGDLDSAELEAAAFDIVFCHAALFQVDGLEAVVERIGRSLRRDGVFIIVDIVMRNGYLLWPETAEVARAMWRALPAKFRLNHSSYSAPLIDDELWQPDAGLGALHRGRPQDILPVIERRFATRHFVPYFSLCRRFFDTMYGPNYDLAAPLDRAAFDWIWQLDVHHLAAGRLRPETFFGIYQQA